MVNTAVSAYYYLRIVKAMYLTPPADETPVRTGLPNGLAVVVAAAAVIFFGIYPTPLIEFARDAVEVLLVAI